jgi:hypothetical protein
MVSLIARFPRLAAWIVCCALIGAITVEALLGVTFANPAPPPDAQHVHGIIAAVLPTGVFALQVEGHTSLLWFHRAAGASISMAHLWRHLREHAGTDVVYEEQPNGLFLALRAD